MISHSKLGASSSKRFIVCPGSNNFIATLPDFLLDDSSEFAAEGTASHALGEKYLLSGENTEDEHVQLYLDTVREMASGPSAQLYVEHAVRLNDEMWGTCDSIISDPLEGELTIVDYKYGVGVAVEAANNTQLMYYALGALKEFGNHYSKFTMVICQPRAHHEAGPVRSSTITLAELLAFEAVLMAAAERTKDPLAPLIASKDCKFCAAKAMCPALRKSLIEGMSNPDLGEALKAAENLSTYKASLERVIFKSLMSGKPVDNFKLVESRSSRKWRDVKGLEETLKDVTEAWTHPELKSVSQMEKIKALKDIVREHSFKQPGGLTLAKSDDKRAAFNKAASDFADVEIND